MKQLYYLCLQLFRHMAELSEKSTVLVTGVWSNAVRLADIWSQQFEVSMRSTSAAIAT